LILADSSAWIEYLRRSGSTHHRTMHRLIELRRSLAITEPVVMEVLSGLRSGSDVAEVRALMLALPMLTVGGLAGFEEAAAIYRACRTGGETIRSMLDCLVAVPAIRAGASILHRDRDFDVIARHTELQLEPVG
jgi:hypothetical protein